MMVSVEVRIADPSERERVTHVLTLAFSADPATRWLYPEADAFVNYFPKFIQVFGGPAFDHDSACIAADLGGASLWFPPGIHPDGAAIETVVRATTREANRDAIFSAFEQMDEFHPEEPHWYLPMIGVDPARQGRGIGSALLRQTLARVDEEAMPAYLESSNPANVPLYQRHGFEVRGDEIRGADGPPIIPMYRPAR